MKIEQAIEMLKENRHKGVKDIVLAFWIAEDFDRAEGEAWATEAAMLEDSIDWTGVNDQITDLLNNK
jgi:hypothetical protein